MHVEGRSRGMEEHTMTIICRRSIALVAFVTAAITANANSLVNPGFETGAASNTDQNAASWVQFNDAYRTATNDTAAALTAHSGAYAMKTFGPFGTTPDASGAYQALSASAGQNWRLTGYCLNWQGDPLKGPNSFIGGGESSYGAASLIFLDSTGGTGNVLLAVDGPHYGSQVPFPLNQWQSFEVDATAPAGTATVRAQVSHIGYSANPGSVYWDDLNLYPTTGTSNVIAAITQPAVQVSWPTTPPTSNGTVNVQIQKIGDLLLGAQSRPSSNLMLNPSFEPGIDGSPNAASGDMFMSTPTVTTNGPWLGWNNWAGPVYSAYYTQRIAPEDGVQCAKTYSGPNGGVYQSVAATVGESFQATAWFENSSSDPMQGAETADLRLIFHDAANGNGNTLSTVVSASVVSTATTHDVWQQLSVTAVAPSNTVSVTLMGFFNNPGYAGGSMFMDNAGLIGTPAGGWQNLGPVYPGNGTTNQIYDTISTNKAQFYRVTTQ